MSAATLGPRETVARAMADASDVRVRRNENGSFEITFNIELDPKTLAIIGTVAKRHERSLGFQIWKIVADIFRAWRHPARPRDPADRIAARYGE